MIHVEHARARSMSRDKIERLWDDDCWIAEEKLDGWRFLVHFGGDLERPLMIGRRISRVTGQLSEKGDLLPGVWPAWEGDLGHTVLDCELMPPAGATFRDLASFANASPEVVRATVDRLGWPTLRAFDIPMWDGVDWREQPLSSRREILEGVVAYVGHRYLTAVDAFAQKRETYDRILQTGGEGVILKDLRRSYGDPGAWIKVKRLATLDVVVTDFTDAKFGRTGKYDGLVGAAVVSVFSPGGSLVEIGRVSGMDDATRVEMTRNPGRWIGSVIEIEAQEWALDRLRHPRFVRARPDADPAECTLEKIMSDLKVRAR